MSSVSVVRWCTRSVCSFTALHGHGTIGIPIIHLELLSCMSSQFAELLLG